MSVTNDVVVVEKKEAPEKRVTCSRSNAGSTGVLFWASCLVSVMVGGRSSGSFKLNSVRTGPTKSMFKSTSDPLIGASR